VVLPLLLLLLLLLLSDCGAVLAAIAHTPQPLSAKVLTHTHSQHKRTRLGFGASALERHTASGDWRFRR
jgi:hypothetical protein